MKKMQKSMVLSLDFSKSKENNSLMSYVKISPINKKIFSRMRYSWAKENPVALEDLRFLSIKHWDFFGKECMGELIVHRLVAQECLEIFQELYFCKFPIAKICLIDEYKADDEQSMQDNNSSCFCSRPIVGQSKAFSHHSYGLAIDINPLYNPYVKSDGLVLPTIAKPYISREDSLLGKITGKDACYQAFRKRGWYWGGDWEDPTTKDYQHFSKAPRAWRGDFSELSF